MSIAITLKNINKYFEGNIIPEMKTLDDINLEIKTGEFITMVGPSGSGKSTLLRIMSGLEKAEQGEVIFGEGITSKDFGFVFQHFALLPWLTIFQNVEIGLHNRNMTKAERYKIVNDELKIMGLEKYANMHPKDISGGLRQRVGIARAFATQAKIIFMDEPFSALDSFTAETLRTELLAIWEKRKPTIVMITHTISDAIKLGDRIAIFSPRPARIERIMNNDLPRPRVPKSPEFAEMHHQINISIRP